MKQSRIKKMNYEGWKKALINCPAQCEELAKTLRSIVSTVEKK